MSAEDEKVSSRGYCPHFAVQYRGAQRPHQRFGQSFKDEIRAMLDGNDMEDYPDNFAGEWPDIPRVARMRMNLTALSQYYNLYFVAYRGYIHVYRPNRTAQSTLDRRPLAILRPNESQTPMAHFVNGHINRRFPHEINNMLVGDLGDFEVLLICRDNGEVVAWYTHVIARFVEEQLAGTLHDHGQATAAGLRHFWADNVGMSAWGLAIHSASRLIAVTANTTDVTVFAFALEDCDDDDDDDDKADEMDEEGESAERPTPPPTECPWRYRESEAEHMRSQRASMLVSMRVEPRMRRTSRTDSEAAERLAKKFRKRHRTWRIIIPLGPDASNLPSVVFCEDVKGYADRVAAIDINGNLFIANIWKIGTPPVKVPPHNVQNLRGSRVRDPVGWAVLPITDAQLRPAKTLHEAFGMTPHNIMYRGKTHRGAWLDISRGMVEVGDDAAYLGHFERFHSFDKEDHSTETDGLDDPHGGLQVSHFQMPLVRQAYEPDFDDLDGLDVGREQPIRRAMTMVPVTGAHHHEFNNPKETVNFASTDRGAGLPGAMSLLGYRGSRDMDAEKDRLLNGVSFLRAYDDNVEILCLESKENGCGVVCHHILPKINFHHDRPYWDMTWAERCIMLLTIPELQMVIIGSMCGRVALLTLTKPRYPPGHLLSRHAQRGFRVEAVLPLMAEEEAHERPHVCLLGIAVSPVPEPGAQGLELRRRRRAAYGGRKTRDTLTELQPRKPARWRLILNYMDHTILQYDIVRRLRQDVGVEEALRQKSRPRRAKAYSTAPQDEQQDFENFEYSYVPADSKGWAEGWTTDGEESSEDDDEEGSGPDHEEDEDDEDDDDEEQNGEGA